jgi:hypothetical protein
VAVAHDTGVKFAQTNTGIVVTDAILVFTPIYLIWPARLPKGTKIRLSAVFAATLATTAISLYKVYTTIVVGGLAEEISAEIEVEPRFWKFKIQL